MDYPVAFARHFARLVWLLLREPTNIDGQKASLRALVAASREGPVRLNAHGEEMSTNSEPVPDMSDLADLCQRMGVEQVAIIEADAGAAAADLLNAARLLAGIGADGPRIAPLGTVRFLTPLPEIESDTSVSPLLPDTDFGAAIDAAPPSAPPPTPPRPSIVRPILDQGASNITRGLFEHFAATPTSLPAYDELLAQLDAATTAGRLMGLLDRIARMAEEAERSGQRAVASEVLHRIVRRERDSSDGESKRAFVGTIRRLSRPTLLRAVAEELVRSPVRREEHMAVLTRTGEDGADALIEQLVAATDRSERRIYFDALIELRAGVPTLVHMLGDPRWFVARNAAVLLGEMQARDAERPLSEQLYHDDERVRHAATIALMRLGTPRSLPAIEHALQDGAPQIRMHAAAALAEHKHAGAAIPLLRALEDERDDEVRAAFLLALGRLGTPDAVEHLIAMAQPERGMFRRKTPGLRVAAIRGLAEGHTPGAIDALRELTRDKEPDIREAAVQALRRAGDAGRRVEPSGW